MQVIARSNGVVWGGMGWYGVVVQINLRLRRAVRGYSEYSRRAVRGYFGDSEAAQGQPEYSGVRTSENEPFCVRSRAAFGVIHSSSTERCTCA